MNICIASGKGGTGKTTLAVNLALALGDRAELLDCDVEEPNAHILLQPQMERNKVVNTPIPLVDLDKCTFCGECARICRFSAIVVVAKKVLLFPELCHSCGGCLAICPSGAISEQDRELGQLNWGLASGEIRLLNGKLRVGETMVPPLIKQVRKEAAPEAIIIIDAPPGTSCPVIAAMRGVDYVVLVTEPTPFGLHDLKLAIAAVKLLQIPCGLVINRADIGTDEVYTYAQQEGLPVLLTIPFERRIAELYSRGIPLVKELPEWQEKFVHLFNEIEHLVGQTSKEKLCMK